MVYRFLPLVVLLACGAESSSPAAQVAERDVGATEARADGGLELFGEAGFIGTASGDAAELPGAPAEDELLDELPEAPSVEPQTDELPMAVDIVVEGEMPTLEDCAGEASAQAVASYSGMLEIGPGGVFAEGFGAQDALVEATGDCDVDPQAAFDSVESVTIHAELAPTLVNCTAMCDSYAATESMLECAGTLDLLECAGVAEIELSASCMAECTDDQTVAITADITLTGEDVSIDADGVVVAGAYLAFDSLLAEEEAAPTP